MKINFKIYLILGLSLLTLLFTSCEENKKKDMHDESASGSVRIAYPEQMTETMDAIVSGFNEDFPLIKVDKKVLSGVDAMRAIAQKKDSCDVLIYDDYKLIELFLIPDLTKWTVKFARDEIVIAYNDASLYKDEMNLSNWYETLLKPDVSFGRIDPHDKSCGYRTVSSFKLAAKHYNDPDLTYDLMSKNDEQVFKNIDALANALSEKKIDYAIMYKSMATVNNFKFFEIPKIMNLNHPDLFSYYSEVNVLVLDKDSLQKYPMQGAPVIYGLSITENTHNMNNSLIFSEYFLSKDKGITIISESGITPMIPSRSFYYKILPESLKKFNKE